jgi:TolB-like protein/DNA-binding winged helix-turn-helix (wHTH) protein/Tfp pilus assembly protein PilF
MTSAKFRFLDYELDPAGFELTRSGHRIRLERKPLGMLILLVENQGHLVPREEIVEKIWGKDFFFDAENGVNNAIRKIRAALNDDAEQPRFVETSVGRGYRFILPVETLHEPPDSPLTTTADLREGQQVFLWRRVWMPGLALGALLAAAFAFNFAGIRNRVSALTVPGIHSLVVLPLENLSGDPHQEYFADGMTDALITDLAQISDVRVISRTSAMQYKGTHKSLQEIAQALAVDAVVEGSVVRSGNRVRITAQLIQAATDRHLWAESFEGPANDIVSIQDEVARAIAGRIAGELHSPPKQTALNRKSIIPDAYEAYLRGLYFFDKRGAETSKKSAEYFRKAIAADPEFAPAYAGLAESLPAVNWFNGKPPVDAMPEAMAAAKRALELDDNLAEAHIALGGLLSLYDWNWGEAEKELKRGLQLSPNNSLAHERYAMWLQSTGRVSEALLEAKQAQHLDPLSFFMNRELGRSFYLAGKYDEAIEQLHRSEELEPHSSVVWSWVSLAYEQQGKQKEAIQVRLAQTIDSSSEEVASLRQAYAAGGSNGYWTRWIQLHSSSATPAAEPYFLAVAEARLGNADRVWEWMEKSADQREVWVTWIKVDPLLESVRSHPGYKKLLRRIHLSD